VVTREPEFDQLERSKLLALLEYDGGVCACGVHKSLSHDKRNVFTLEAEWCPLCQSLAAQNRELAQLDSAAEERAGKDKAKRLPSDGRSTFLRQLSQSEIDERRAAAAAAREVTSGGT
jgi:hypothetical protein